MLSEAIFELDQLITLDLSTNFIAKVIDLSNLPQLENLNLSHNCIKAISIKDIICTKKTLKTLLLSNNKITFEANSFVNFIEGLSLFNLKNMSIKENTFLEEIKILKNSYSVFIVSSLINLTIFDDVPVKLDRNTISAVEIKKQILSENKYTKNVNIQQQLWYTR